MRPRRMVRCRQAAWLLYHVGVDTSALLFADEVGSVCTVLANSYCKDAYSLLPPFLFCCRWLVQNKNGGSTSELARKETSGILLDTNNLSKKCSNRDSEAVQLLLFGSSERTRHELFHQLMLDHNDHSFVEYLKNTYRNSTADGNEDSPPEQKHLA